MSKHQPKPSNQQQFFRYGWFPPPFGNFALGKERIRLSYITSPSAVRGVYKGALTRPGTRARRRAAS